MEFKVTKFLTAGIIFLFYLQTQAFAEKHKLKFCLAGNENTKKIISFTCPNLEKSKSNIECVIAVDRISCLKLLINNQVDFMTVEPEDLRIIGTTEDYNNKIFVTHELRIWENEQSSYQMVTIIRQSVHDVWHIAKTRFCSSGMEPSLFALDYLKYFENQLIISRCNSMKSLLENRLSAISKFFESACIGGPWTNDHQFDSQLKKKYPNLCSQCGDSTCSAESKYFGEEGVLMCLTDGGGDIAWSRLDYAHRHFKELYDDKNEYYFLCLNGTLKNLTDPHPCVWFEVPWRTVIARKDIAEEVKNFINYETNGVDDSLSLLQEDIRRTPINVESFRTPNDYLKESFLEFYDFKDHLQCKDNNRVVKWCVVSNLEARKCEWISKVANNYGIEPLIKCVQKTSRENCIKSVVNKQADIFAITSDENLEVKEKGLKPIVHMVSNTDRHENKMISIVKKLSNFYTFQDLKNHKACFTSFRDDGWNTFLYIMKNLTGDSNWYCKDKEMVSQFFSEIIMADLNKSDNSFPKNFISPLSNYKNLDKAVFNCLNFEGGDVAFVNLSSILHYYPGSLDRIFRPLCMNGTKSISGKTEKCYSSRKTQGSLMVHEKISMMREDEIYLMLVDLDNLFRGHFQGLTPLLSLYGPFDGEKNIIFPEHTQYLEKDVGGGESSLSYNEIFKDLMSYNQKCSSANSIKIKFYIIIVAPLVYLWSIFSEYK